MTIKEFNQMKMGDRADTLWPAGLLIDHRVEWDENMIVVYQMPRFLVEVKYNINANAIIEITALPSDKYFEDFLKSVDLFKLLN